MYLGTKEVAALLGIHERTALRLFQSGEIPGRRVGPKLWRIGRQAFDDYMQVRGDFRLAA